MHYIQQPQTIEANSFTIISDIIRETRPDYRFASPLHEAIIKRVIHTTADFDWLDILWFSADALEQLCDALRHPCIIYTDTTMALSGINKRLLATFGGECRCYISDPRVVRAAKTQGITRSMAAINRTPRHTIESAVREAIGPARGADVEIFAPEGEARAQKTYNSRLGILGGISIIGTTGIVTPMSEESWKRSLSLELEIKRASGLTRVILVPGNHGERFVREQMGVDTQAVVTMSNFVGYMIEEAVRLGFCQIVLVGHPGKLIKIAAGIFHTHSHIADARMETLVAHLALLGAPLELLTLVGDCDTTEAAMEHIEAYGFGHIYNHLARRICLRVMQMLRFTKTPPVCDAILFSFDNHILGSNRPVDEIAKELQC
ncbi:cobalamin biosynthesis protein CbiD [Salmonella enterica subsp. enterica serovar Muenchen]|nr:cobalamin biosynthesis protein CbiD [Salmonella enterica subsp. enterica serovar Muenchen]